MDDPSLIWPATRFKKRRMNAPHPFLVSLSHHAKVVWAVLGILYGGNFALAMFVVTEVVWWFVGAVLLGAYLVQMWFITRFLRRIKAEADYEATRR